MFAADAGEPVGLEHAQQADLRRQVHRPDLVEEDGAARGRLELALGERERAGERALLVAEQLAGDELLGNRAGVDRNERALGCGGCGCAVPRATSSLPVPDSPTMSTGAPVGGTRSMRAKTSRIRRDPPTIPSNTVGARADSRCRPPRERRRSAAALAAA